MNKIMKSLSVIVFVGAIALAGTGAYFSDTETSTGNMITAGSLDLTVNGVNGDPVEAVVIIEDMKPSQTWYSGLITLKVLDNPGKLYKKIVRNSFDCETVTVTEPECDAIGGDWDAVGGVCYNVCNDENDLTKVTWFDLEVWVGDPDNAVSGQNAPMCDAGVTTDCWDIIIPDDTITVYDISSQMIYLGTYGERMTENKIVIRQSFHMKATAENEYQSDSCTFTEEFVVLQTNAPHPTNVYIPDGVVLDSINVGDSDSLSMTNHSASGWLDYYQGIYGGRDGGESIAMVWGDGGFCDTTNDDASFVLDAGTETASTLKLRHYDGVSQDSFDVYVDGVLEYSYLTKNNGGESPDYWYTTEIPVSFTGLATIEIVSTGAEGAYCDTAGGPPYYYGQVALNWAKITN